MCHAILRVKYLADKAASLIEVATERDLQAKVDELCSKDQVISVQIFPRNRDVVLTKKWETRAYTPVVEDYPQASQAKAA